MFTYNQKIATYINSNPVEFFNGFTEEQLPVWESNHVNISTNTNVLIDANGNRNEYIQLQKSWKESAKCQTFADNTYQSFPEKHVGSLTASLQCSPYNNLCRNYSEPTYDQCPFTSVNSTYSSEQSIRNNYYKINHRCNITNKMTQKSSGCYRTIVKRKRKRTIFTTEQVEALENIFSKKAYISRDDRQVIVNQLNLSDKSVKIWFQNRRLKGKRRKNDDDDDVLEENNVIDSDSLDYVESEIRKNTNEFGYVTLHDNIMNDLVNIIDHCLSKSNDEDDSTSSNSVENGNMYEPISPASSECSGSQTNTSEWESPEPTESLQTLLDIQSLIQV